MARNGGTVAVPLPSVGGKVELGVGSKFSLNRVTFAAYLTASPGTNVAGTVELTGSGISLRAEFEDDGVLGQITVDLNLSLVLAVEDIVLGGVEGEPVIAGTVTFGASDVDLVRVAVFSVHSVCVLRL